MTHKRIRIGDLLLDRGLINQEQLEEALKIQKKTGERLGAVLIRQEAVEEIYLLKALADLLDTELWDLEFKPPTDEALCLVPIAECTKFRVVPVAIENGIVKLAMADVVDIEALDYIAHCVGQPVKPVLVSEKLLVKLLGELSGMGDLGDVVSRALDVISDSTIDSHDDVNVSVEDTAPVMTLVNQLILDAIVMQASDIHIEPCKNRVEVRVRLDGHLHTIRDFPVRLLPMVAARIKIMSELDIVEKRRPQDGRFNIRLEGKSIDVRVSVLPTHYGPRVVMRILDGAVARRTLAHLGFTEHNQSIFEDLVDRPYGMVLVTGPTGSGKTTTLYAALNSLKDTTKNVMTCEDPIEYDVDGVAQSQVNEKTGLTFATQIRAILRQDPDIVLVGEIRDQETAETAIRASMTGHLVLSTLHCNTAVSALPRLFDMGAEPYLLSTSLAGVTAQRLVRVLCDHCKVEADPSDVELAAWSYYNAKGELGSIFKPQGCKECFGVGYKGRTGVHEILSVSPELATAISERASMEALTNIATKSGYHSMQADALERVKLGDTSFDEIRRAIALTTFNSAPESDMLRLAS